MTNILKQKFEADKDVDGFLQEKHNPYRVDQYRMDGDNIRKDEITGEPINRAIIGSPKIIDEAKIIKETRL